ncbi:hypothetical protein HQ496_10950 [bacterium]|nr:hypothetical protein [bacterium]
MDSDRRYSQKEIADIFKKASEEQERIKERSALEDGLTLEDLHLIAREAGISPEFISDAAARLEHTVEAPPEKRFLGLQTSVHRIIDLKAPLSDDSWDKLVVEIRQAFGARGKITREGKLREWSNGNLHILVEPTPHGHRLRMGTEKGSAKGFLWASISWIMAGIFIFISSALASGVDFSILFPAIFFAVAGIAGIGFTGLQLSQWRYDRADQMDAIGSIALNLVSKGSLRAPGALHEEIVANHEKDASETAGLDLEYFDRSVEQERVPEKLDLDDAHQSPEQESGPAKRTRA